ncbi:major facilitator superfamily domain-containing protein [Aspergillus bertholletiae]|uniref:Major facilitator superfamily domain-containing protein n=1 Tax=Aspergillus bertholletiae TaxID=1226010 RepID=A0A5N7AUY7_9EURO|nr:major facilitator superfamily domain-containing protein [Aspergillus bertholletiae]
MAEHPKSPPHTREHTLSPPSSPLYYERSSEEKIVSRRENNELPHPPALEGWRLRLLTIGLCLCVFLSSLDITIVSTSLTAISNDLHAFKESSWVVSSYLTSYFSFLIIWAKMSDFLGRKIMLVAALVLFLAFSGGCGGARTPVQSSSILCRAFQGVGGAGIFSMAPIIVAEMVEPAKYGAYNAIVSLAIAFSFLLGPLFGGAISDGTTWRWIFYINLPVGLVGLALVLVAMPASFPDLSAVTPPTPFTLIKRNVPLRGRIDYPGFVMLLAASVLLIVAIEEAGISFGWSSGLVIAFLVVAGSLFIAFLAWQWYLDHARSEREPIIPWEFIKKRVLMGMYLNALLSGVPFVTLVLELPLRFESINGLSGLNSGICILPFTLTIAFGSALTGGLTARGRVPPIMVLLVATMLQILGMGLLYSVPVTADLPARIYGYQILAGLGTGLSLTTLLNIVPFVVKRRVLAVALGGVTQLRILGGAVGVSIATNLLNNTAKTQLATQLPAPVLAGILRDVSSVDTLSTADQSIVHAAFGKGYHQQLAMMLGFCAAEVIALALMWEWPMRRLA